MNAGFSLKKIKKKQTLGQTFRRKRKKEKISILDAEIGTNIRSKYLVSIEEDDWFSLPAHTYTKGFVSRYAKFLGLEQKKVMECYNRERRNFSNINNLISPTSKIQDKKFLITPKVVIPIAVGLVLVAVFSFIIYQVYGFAAAPELVITSPDNNSILEDENIEIRGVTDQGVYVYVNDENIMVSSEGKFVAEFQLHSGVNIIEVKAVNKAEKEKILTYTVEHKSKTAININDKEKDGEEQ